jgi:hypothetical protein
MRIFFLVIFLLLFAGAKSQNKVYVYVESISESSDTTNYAVNKKFALPANPLSPITEIATIGNVRIGLQVELLQSNLKNKRHLVIGYALFKKTNTTWEVLEENPHFKIETGSNKDGNKGLYMGMTQIQIDGLSYSVSLNMFVNLPSYEF